MDFAAFRFMAELRNFHNDGFGWVCRRCESESAEPQNISKHSRLISEGEAEGKSPRLSNAALARWTDAGRNTLICPRCGTTENIK
jgi:hypothetical protein